MRNFKMKKALIWLLGTAMLGTAVPAGAFAATEPSGSVQESSGTADTYETLESAGEADPAENTVQDKTQAPDPTVTPTPSASPDASGSANSSASPDVTGSPDSSVTPAPSDSQDLSVSSAPSETAAPSATPVPSESPDVSVTPSPDASETDPDDQNQSQESVLTPTPVPAAPQMLEGNNSTWDENAGGTLLFRSDADFEDFISVTIDSKEIDGSYYDKFSGSTYVELHSDYLKTLTAGEHVIGIVSKSGTAEATFTVKKKENQDAGKNLQAGTYRVTANLYIPGEKNKQLPGTTAYMTNPNNPLGIGGHSGIPMEPVKDNATMVVAADGTKTVIVDVVNPVFTLQKISSGNNVEVLAAVWDKEVYQGVSGTVSRTGRITALYVKLKDESGKYEFGDCTEFPTLLEEDWNVPMELGVDFSSAVKTSDSTEVNIPGGSTSGNKPEENKKEEKKKSNNNSSNNKKSKNGNSSGNGGNTGTTSTGKLKAGSYTVAANIWIDRSSSGLPLSPHLTSSVFPPKDPVSSNAKLTVDESGRAVVNVPIVIPEKVMTVQGISGLNIINSSSSGGKLTSITVDLGIVTDPNAVITKSCTVTLQLGELAQTISKKSRDQVWSATFQVSLSGVPSAASGGGNVDVNALISAAQNESSASASASEIEVKVGVLPGSSALFLTEMMQEAKEEMSAVPSYKYVFTVAELKDTGVSDKEKTSGEDTDDNTDEDTGKDTSEDTAEMTREQQLENQLLDRFEKGEYDLIVCPADAAEKFWKGADAEENFRILTVTKSWEKGDSANTKAENADAESTETENTGADTIETGGASETPEPDLTVTLVSAEFVKNQEKALEDYIAGARASLSEISADPEKAAETAVTLGLYEKIEDAQEELEAQNFGIADGRDMEQVFEGLLDKEQLPAEELYYIDGGEEDAAASGETTSAETGGTDAATGESTSEESTDADSASSSEHVDYTDQDALSSAIEQALEAKNSTADTGNSSATESSSATENSSATESNSADEALAAAANIAAGADASSDAEASSSIYDADAALDTEESAKKATELTPGTYQITANMYLPGELNTQLPGTTAYMTNPDNPLGVGGHEGIPMTPVSDNATLVVGDDGTKNIKIDIVNPVFTLQSIADPQNSEILAGVRDTERYEGTNGVGRDGRIVELYIRLLNDSSIYSFDTCTEFPTLLETEWNVPLKMGVDFTTAEKLSDETALEIPEDSAGASTVKSDEENAG